MTEVNGLRLAYRGFVTGIAGAYVWAAIAMALAGLVHGDPIAPLRPVATAISPLAGTPELAFVLGPGRRAARRRPRRDVLRLLLRPLLHRAPHARRRRSGGRRAGVGAARGRLDQLGQAVPVELQVIGVAATIGFGLVLGAGVPVRGEVTALFGVGLDIELRLVPRPATGQRGDPVAQRRLHRAEGQLVPRDLVGAECADLARLGGRLRAPPTTSAS